MIALALISTGHLSAIHFTVPVWVKLICATSMALGTATGGWRIINTMGNRITTVESPQGFAAESSSAATILASSSYGYPLSTTQVVSGGVTGAGLGKRGGVVHWPVVGQMVIACMPDPTGRWLNRSQWQCPRCAWVNGSGDQTCQECGGSVRPPKDEPIRPPDPLDLIGHDETRAGDTRLAELASKAVHTLTRVTRAKAMALIGGSLRNGLKERGDQGDRAWQAITELPEGDQRAALGYLVDDLEQEGVALYRIDGDEQA